MNNSPYSDSFLKWAAMAGYVLSFEDGAWVLGNIGGEILYCLRLSNGVYTVTQVERGVSQGFEIACPDIKDVERHMAWWLSIVIRSQRHLPLMYCAFKVDDIRPGWSVVKSDGVWILYTPSGEERARFGGDQAVVFSWIADLDVDEMYRSFLDPDGSPLFSGCWIGPPR